MDRDTCRQVVRTNKFEDYPIKAIPSGGLSSGKHRGYDCHWMRDTTVFEQEIEVRRMSAIVEQESLYLDFRPIPSPKCDVRAQFCDMGLNGVIV